MDDNRPDDFYDGVTFHSELKGVAFYLSRALYLWTRTDDITGAVADYTEAIRLEPGLAEAYRGRAAVRDQQKDYEGAVADYTEAIRLEPGLAEAYRGRAAVRGQQKDYEGAVADYTEAIRLEPTDDANFYCRGAVREEQKDYEGAIADYTEAIRLEPTDYNYVYRGDARLVIGDLDGAIADYRTAIDKDPEPWWGWYHKVGTVYALKADTTNAVTAFNQALDLNPTDDKRRREMQEYVETYSSGSGI